MLTAKTEIDPIRFVATRLWAMRGKEMSENNRQLSENNRKLSENNRQLSENNKVSNKQPLQLEL